MKNIVLFNDLPGYGRVALSASVPVLTAMGHRVMNIPTALISNTLDFGKFEMLDTTEYMKQTLQVWEELQFPIDAISAGYIANQEQAAFLRMFCEKKAKQGTLVFCDPIMADHGKLYHGIPVEKVQQMRDLIRNADVCTPNYTEALFLTETGDYPAAYPMDAVEEHTVFAVVDRLRKLGAKSVVITSVHMKTDDAVQDAVVGYDALRAEYFQVPFVKRTGVFPGAGDLFSSFMIGKLLEEDVKDAWNLQAAVAYAVKRVSDLIASYEDDMEKHHALIECFFSQLCVEDKNA